MVVENTYKFKLTQAIPSHWKSYRIGSVFFERKEKVSDSDFAPLSVTMQGVVPQLDNVAKTSHGDNRKKVLKGDFVINSRSDRKGSGGLSKYDGSVSLINTVLSPNSSYYSKYTNYLLTSKLFQEEFYKFGKGIVDDMWSTKYFDMKSIRVPCPPIPEQKAIANYLDTQLEKITHFIKKKKALIVLLKEQRQGVIENMFNGFDENWNNERVKYIADVKFSSVDKHSLDGQAVVRLCNYTDVYKNEFITNDFELMIATASSNEIKNFTVYPDDVIITKDSESSEDIAMPALIAEELENCVCGYHLAMIRTDKSKIIGEFLFRAFQTKRINDYYAIRATGVTRVGLSYGDISNVFIPYPSVNKQKQIVHHIRTETTKIDQAITKAEQEISLIKEYKEAMVAEAVLGKLYTKVHTKLEMENG